MFKTLKRIATALEILNEIEFKRNEMIENDMTNELRFKDNYLTIMNETSKNLIDNFKESE